MPVGTLHLGDMAKGIFYPLLRLVAETEGSFDIDVTEQALYSGQTKSLYFPLDPYASYLRAICGTRSPLSSPHGAVSSEITATLF
jgi:hypothetical protein